MRALVAGAGGFIGGHLVKRLLDEGHEVRAADCKAIEHWYQPFAAAENIVTDLKEIAHCERVAKGSDVVYNLAADMGGMGFIERHKAECMLSVLISTHMLQAAVTEGVHRLFYSSSACVYAAHNQTDAHGEHAQRGLAEGDAYPAMPEDGYGWEKLFSERMAGHFTEDFGLPTRVARYHNVYGPHGTYQGGREKAPAAICRKVIEAKASGNLEINIWGDGEQTRSFMYIDDCIEGTRRLMDSEPHEPLNLGSSELVTINQLVDLTEDIAGVRLERTYDLSAPQGVRGRNSDNTALQQHLNWQPTISLRVGMERTYAWVHDEMTRL